jgi:hypothetical protein
MQPTIGRIVIYREIDGRGHASIVTGIREKDAVDLTVFPSGSNPYPLVNVPYDPPRRNAENEPWSEQNPGTWRWPERR